MRIQRSINGKSYDLVPPRSHKKLVAAYEISNSLCLGRGLRKTILSRGMISAEAHKQSRDALSSLASCCTIAAIPEPCEQLPALLLLPATPRFHFHSGPGPAPVGHLAPSVQGWPARGKPQGSPQQQSSSEDRSRYVFFFFAHSTISSFRKICAPPLHTQTFFGALRAIQRPQSLASKAAFHPRTRKRNTLVLHPALLAGVWESRAQPAHASRLSSGSLQELTARCDSQQVPALPGGETRPLGGRQRGQQDWRQDTSPSAHCLSVCL